METNKEYQYEETCETCFKKFISNVHPRHVSMRFFCSEKCYLEFAANPNPLPN